jgi:hypothetical protein
VHYAKVALRGRVPVAGSVRAASIRPGISAAVMFAAAEHLASASGTTAVASETGALHLHQHLRAIHLRWLEKLFRLREARPNIAARGLFREWHFPLAILLHLLYLVFNDNGLVDHVLEVGVVCVK